MLTANQESRTSRTTGRRAMTLVESITSIFIVGVMLVAALNTLSGTMQARQIRMKDGKAEMLAYDLLGEILAAHYEEPAIGVDQEITRVDGSVVTRTAPVTQTTTFGPETGEDGGTRIDFDDVDDYDRWSENTVQGKDGTPLNGYAGWTRNVIVTFASSSTGAASDRTTETGLKLINVTVNDSSKRSWSVFALRSQASGYDSSPTVKQNLTSWVGVQLQTTGSNEAVYGGAASLNQSAN